MGENYVKREQGKEVGEIEERGDDLEFRSKEGRGVREREM